MASSLFSIERHNRNGWKNFAEENKAEIYVNMYG